MRPLALLAHVLPLPPRTGPPPPRLLARRGQASDLHPYRPTSQMIASRSTMSKQDIRIKSYNVHKNWDLTSSLLALKDFDILMIQEVPFAEHLRRIPPHTDPQGEWIGGHPSSPSWTMIASHRTLCTFQMTCFPLMTCPAFLLREMCCAQT